MEEELISFETAKLAKEKGFPQNLFNTSWYNEFGIENGRTDLDKDGKPYNGRIIPVELKEEYKRESFSAPSQSLLQKWLREVHNIHVLPMLLGGFYDYNIYHPKNHCKECTGKYEIYEEALEIGLQQALNMIK